MKNFRFYRQSDFGRLLSKRKGEEKFGEKLHIIPTFEDLKNISSKYVIIGVPEDIGIRANYGKPGAAGTFKNFLKAFVNIQVNRFNDPVNVALLGEVNCEHWMDKATNIDSKDPNYHAKLGDIVRELDITVAHVVEKVISENKIPIIIGGGHNNAFGNIKGASKAIQKPINVLNIDAHTDLRQLEHRHSGNGFSYAIAGEYLRKYTVFGLHKNYTPEYILKEMDSSENLKYILLEDLLEKPDELNSRYQTEITDISSGKFGLELDCDSIVNFPSSAKSPVGFSMNEIRSFISTAKKHQNCCYFHICEASTAESEQDQVGKALSYFVSDFIS